MFSRHRSQWLSALYRQKPEARCCGHRSAPYYPVSQEGSARPPSSRVLSPAERFVHPLLNELYLEARDSELLINPCAIGLGNTHSCFCAICHSLIAIKNGIFPSAALRSAGSI